MYLRLDKVQEKEAILEEQIIKSKDIIVRNNNKFESLKVVKQGNEETILGTAYFPMRGRSSKVGWDGTTNIGHGEVIVVEECKLFGLVEEWISYGIYLSNIPISMIYRITPSIIIGETASDTSIPISFDMSYDIISSNQYQYLYYNSDTDNRLLIMAHYMLRMSDNWEEQFYPREDEKASRFKDGKNPDIVGGGPIRGLLPQYYSRLLLRMNYSHLKIV
jgi:hypothetical protein